MTRIGGCLHDFNRLWARRVLGQGAVVLMITDGLDREGAIGIEQEMERLHKSSDRLIWLTPQNHVCSCFAESCTRRRRRVRTNEHLFRASADSGKPFAGYTQLWRRTAPEKGGSRGRYNQKIRIEPVHATSGFFARQPANRRRG